MCTCRITQLNCGFIFVNFCFKDPHFYPKLLAGTVRFCANEAKGNQPCPGLIVKSDFQLHLHYMLACSSVYRIKHYRTLYKSKELKEWVYMYFLAYVTEVIYRF